MLKALAANCAVLPKVKLGLFLCLKLWYTAIKIVYVTSEVSVILKVKKIQFINFFVFFIGWVVVFLLGADFPPPIGFLWLVALVLFLDIVQYFYLDRYFLKHIETHKKLRLFIANIIFYFMGGFIVSFAVIVFSFTAIGLINSIIWMGVVTFVSVIYGIIFWALNCLLYRKL